MIETEEDLEAKICEGSQASSILKDHRKKKEKQIGVIQSSSDQHSLLTPEDSPDLLRASSNTDQEDSSPKNRAREKAQVELPYFAVQQNM